MSSTPGSSLSKRASTSQEVSLPNKRQRSVYQQVILDEDAYTDALERIIRRDFFPDLDAVELDLECRERLARRHHQLSPRTQPTSLHADATVRHYSETPVSHSAANDPSLDNDDHHHHQQDPSLSNLSLTDFLNTYTSEDNASFAQILSRNNLARRQKHSWAFEGEARHNAIEASRRDSRQRLIDAVHEAVQQTGSVGLIEGAEPGRPGERLVLEHGRSSIVGDRESVGNAKKRITQGPGQGQQQQLLIEGSKEEDSNSQVQPAASTSTAASSTEPPQQSKGKDAGLVETWPFTARNSFMFPPDANLALTAPRPSELQPKEGDKLGLQAPKSINRSNTRIQSVHLEPQPPPPSPSHSNIAAAISQPNNRSGDTPRVQGYSFVDDMPSPAPNQASANQLMTYGTLSSAQPLGEVKEGPFKIPQTPHREALAHSMARKASKNLSKRSSGDADTARRLGLTPKAKGPYGGSLTPGRTPTKEGLSPAAKSLLGRTRTPAGGSSARSVQQGRTPDARAGRARETQSKRRLDEVRWEATPAE